MSSSTPPSAPPPQARLRKKRFIGWVWLIPVIAAFTVLWLGWQSLSTRGPKITITFEDVEGLDAEHTPIRYKNVQVGVVESINLSPDLTKVVVTARMDRRVVGSLTDDAAFWIVKPRFSASGVSGLSTLLSGSYIEMEPGKGQARRNFKGLAEPPVVQSQEPGTSYTLTASQLGSIDVGTPIYFRGIQVGEVLGDNLVKDGGSIDVYVFVRAPYDKLVKVDSRFWNAGGISVVSAGSGLKADIGSLQTLLGGGITFGTSDTVALSPSHARFRLYDDHSSADEAPDGPVVAFRAQFPGSIHGLGVGSSVELNGIRIGRVTAIGLDYDVTNGMLSTPATFELDPALIHFGRTGMQLPATPAVLQDSMLALVRRGLRARLTSASLLTGSLLVSLEVMDDPASSAVTYDNGVMEIPTGPAVGIDELTRQGAALMKGIGAALPQIMGHLNNVLAHLDRITGSPQLTSATTNLSKTLANLQKITQSANTALPPLLKSLQQTTDAVSATANAANHVLGDDPAASQGLSETLRELTGAARSLKDLSEFLDQHPEALLRGRGGN